ncbi:MAG TPA: glycosyltransferase family 9 protein, partial [Burkholderiaceae bacterium]|nr:glycosyltransferase family 9 protein [Burkholderiaceae bacterium]
MHPLVVRLPNHLGDVCMSLPALNALTERFRLCLVGRPWASALFHAYEWPVLPLRGPRWTECRQLYALRRKAQIDDALLLTNSFSTALHMRLAGLRPRGYALDGRSLLLVRAVPAHASRDLHMVPYYHALATAAFDLPAAPLPKQLGLRLRADAHRRARDILAQAAVGEQPYVLLCPVATGLHRG